MFGLISLGDEVDIEDEELDLVRCHKEKGSRGIKNELGAKESTMETKKGVEHEIVASIQSKSLFLLSKEGVIPRPILIGSYNVRGSSKQMT